MSFVSLCLGGGGYQRTLQNHGRYLLTLLDIVTPRETRAFGPLKGFCDPRPLSSFFLTVADLCAGVLFSRFIGVSTRVRKEVCSH